MSMSRFPLPVIYLLILHHTIFVGCHAWQSGGDATLSDRTICTNLVSRAPPASLEQWTTGGSAAAGVVAIARCPSETPPAIAQRCQLSNLDRRIRPETVPVFDSQGRLYINQYCLACNSATDELRVQSALSNLVIICSKNASTPQDYSKPFGSKLNGSIAIPADCRSAYLANADSPALVDCCLLNYQPGNKSRCFSKSSVVHIYSVDIVFNFRIDFFNLSGRSTLLLNGADESAAGRNSSLINNAPGLSSLRTMLRASLVLLSMLSLLCLIAIYCCCCLPGLRNRPGYLLVSHCCALLLVYAIDLLELLGTPRTSRQQQVWLYSLTVFAADAAFCWALLFGCDLLRALSGLGSGVGAGNGGSSSDRQSRIVCALRFATAGWGIPMLFAAAPAVTQHVISLQQQSAQRDNGSISGGFESWRELQLGTVFAPWAGTLALNCLALLAIWRRIFLAARAARQSGLGAAAAGNAGHTRGFVKAKKLAVTALKVSALLGVCWLPFCLAVALGWPTDSTVFLAGQLCRSVQGLLLLIAFGSSARVRQQLAARLAPRRPTNPAGSVDRRRRRRDTGTTACGGSSGDTSRRPTDVDVSKQLLAQQKKR